MVNFKKSAKVCFVIPEYDPDISTHFNYLYDFIKVLFSDFDIFLLIEKGAGMPNFADPNRVYIQKFKFTPLRIIENFLVIFYIRLIGYRDFYIHYSFLSAFNASLISKFVGGRTFYWNCGLPWLYSRNYFREKFERAAYRLVTFLVTGTEGLKNQYAKHYQLGLSKIKVLPNWINVNQFHKQFEIIQDLKLKLNISPKDKVILFVHRLSNRKGAHYLPRIIQGLENEKVVLLIVGGGPEREKIELEIRKSRLEKKVRFLNSIPNKEIQNYFGIADIFIMPSEEEGFPHVLLEAMVVGVPFVAFDVGGVKEISPPESLGYIVAPYDIKSFSNKIKELLHYNGDRIAKLSEIEQSWVKQFDLSITLDKFKDIILK
ncbi:MAG: glycosyltransferase family 4 protein [bacterium]|nr:glycosyltransferase family 4 protein [bacterium]